MRDEFRSLYYCKHLNIAQRFERERFSSIRCIYIWHIYTNERVRQNEYRHTQKSDFFCVLCAAHKNNLRVLVQHTHTHFASYFFARRRRDDREKKLHTHRRHFPTCAVTIIYFSSAQTRNVCEWFVKNAADPRSVPVNSSFLLFPTRLHTRPFLRALCFISSSRRQSLPPSPPLVSTLESPPRVCIYLDTPYPARHHRSPRGYLPAAAPLVFV